MERVFPMKFVRLAVLVGVCSVPACNKPAAPMAPPTPTSAAKASTGTTVAPAVRSDAAVKFGDEFLTALRAGMASAAQLTPEFKKIVAPSATAPDWSAGQWLEEFKGDAAAVEKRTAYPLDATSTLVGGESAAAAPAKAVTYCKFVTKPGGTETLVAWLHTSPVRPAVDLSTDTAAKFAGVAFVDTVLTKQPRLAESLIAPAAAKKLAPPLDDEDAKLGYNRGILTIKLNGFRESFTSATFAPPVKAGANLTMSGELTGPGSERRKFTITVAPVGSNWFVEDFRHD
jgi:hypothetical protein